LPGLTVLFVLAFAAGLILAVGGTTNRPGRKQ
jgi:hypothetical protein